MAKVKDRVRNNGTRSKAAAIVVVVATGSLQAKGM